MVQASQELLIVFDRLQFRDHRAIELGCIVRAVIAQAIYLSQPHSGSVGLSIGAQGGRASRHIRSACRPTTGGSPSLGHASTSEAGP
jgi:hypothetical protein